MSDTDTPVLPTRPPRKRSKRTIAQLLSSVQVALDNTQTDLDLQTTLHTYGYTTERVNEGKQLYQQVMAHQRQQETGRGQQISATSSFKTLAEQAYDTYARLLKVARVALRDQQGDLVLLGLTGKRKRSFSGWTQQAAQFYTNALAEERLLTQLAAFGITEARLREGSQQLAAAEAGNAAQKINQGNAQQATASRDTALRRLRRWYTDFNTIARVAFAEQPQQLEKLGIVARD